MTRTVRTNRDRLRADSGPHLLNHALFHLIAAIRWRSALVAALRVSMS